MCVCLCVCVCEVREFTAVTIRIKLLSHSLGLMDSHVEFHVITGGGSGKLHELGGFGKP